MNVVHVGRALCVPGIKWLAPWSS